jgi:hypothetical protein
MIIFIFIWIGGFFLGAGKLDWWAGMLLISEVAFGLLFIIGGIIVEMLKHKDRNTIW